MGLPLAVTELGDATDCIWNQLPPSVKIARKVAAGNKRDGKRNKDFEYKGTAGRGHKAGKAIPLQDKMQDIWDHMDDLEKVQKPTAKELKEGGVAAIPRRGWDKAMDCLVANEISDRLIGQIGQKTREANQTLGDRFGGRGANIGLGPTF
jgi:hypothetical protein